MTGADSASISSTGQQIISTTKTSELRVGKSGSKMRLWNGSEAQNGDNFNTTTGSGASTQHKFTSGTTCRVWWHNYAVSATLNGGSAIDLNAASSGGSGNNEDVAGAVQGSCQVAYLNCDIELVTSTNLSSGDTVVFTVTSA
jgi:hypothetical protein